MSTRLMRGLTSGLFAMLLLAGCASTSEPEPEPEPMMDPKPAEPVTPPTVRPEPKPTTSAEGVPLDDGGEPIATTFYFDFDRSELKPRARTLLSGHARYLRENSRVKVTINGHCDERGTREYNLALGERRASAVRSYLQSMGVRASQMESVSFGEERPIDPGHNESSWSKNRRAELEY